MQLTDILASKPNIIFFAKKEKKFALLIKKWKVLEEMAEALAIPYQSTQLIQKADCTLSDFYGSCILMQIKFKLLATNQTQIAMKLNCAIEKRKKVLLENPAMICAVILDPRFSSDIINEKNVSLAKSTLTDLYERLKHLKGDDHNEIDLNANNNKNDKDADLLNLYFMKKGLSAMDGSSQGESATAMPRETVCFNSNSSISHILDEFLDEMAGGFLRSDKSVLQFWKTKKDKYPELYQLSTVLFAIPPTQATVERLFSLFGFLYNDWRNQLSQNLLEDMVVIITNEDLFHLVNKEDLAALV